MHTISAGGDTYIKDLEPFLFHEIKFSHGELGEVFLHGEERTVRGAFHMFMPGQRKHRWADTIMYATLYNPAQ